MIDSLRKTLQIWKPSYLPAKVLVSLLSCFTMLFMVWGLFIANYEGKKVSPWNSFIFSDKPSLGVPYDFTGKDLSGHYFGDFLQTLDWAQRENPWVLGIANYPPLPVYLLKIISWLPYEVARFSYFLTMVAVSATVIFLITKGLDKPSRLTLSITLGVAAAPILAAIDRGNNIGFVGPLIGLYCYTVVRGKKKIASAILVLLVSIKIYPVILGIIFLRKRWYKQLALAAAVTISLNLLLFAITPGDFLETLRGFLAANLSFSGARSELAVNNWSKILSQLGLGAETVSRLALTIGTALAFWIPKLAILGLFLSLALRKASDITLLLVLCIAMTFQAGTPLTYNWAWVPSIVALILVELSKLESLEVMSDKDRVLRSQYFWFVASLGLVVIPFGWHIDDLELSLTPYVAWIVSAALYLYSSFVNARLSWLAQRQEV